MACSVKNWAYVSQWAVSVLLISSAAISSRYTRGKGALNETSGLSGTHDSQNFDRKNQTEEFCKGFIENFKVENKPLLMIGYGCIHSDTKEILEKLINTWQIPFVSTMDAKGYISEDNHRWALSTLQAILEPMIISKNPK